ncbi:two-component system chemotaxis response regulator CheB [Litoreibacter ponti]|uniref:protein-glutamate methylesterase n=1 Tax=Litoreibacter ponti TaxID=1510457 RepID=A0A2T6BF51_9RHOB|nr:chemotaxis protein CheB [Litoreibacter ponti]PTX54693.1 two-component system chemotaxis response regulator CheB [Litoreibacter ponti]
MDINYGCVSIGASAGGIQAIRRIINGLPYQLRAPLVITIHAPATSRLERVLRFESNLNIQRAMHGMILRPGVIYTVPGETDAKIHGDRFVLNEALRHDGQFASIDSLMSSIAFTFQAAATGIILSGKLRDGAAGMRMIEEFGGRTIVQDPHEAEFADLPISVLERCADAEVQTTAEISNWLLEHY